MSTPANRQLRQAQFLEQMLDLLGQMHTLSSSVKDFFRSHCELRECHRGEKVLQQHQVCEYYYFISKGVLRGFIEDEGKEITTWISIEGEMATSIYSLHQKKPALENIEAVEPTWLLQLKVEELDWVYRHHPEFNINGRLILQQYYRDAELRAYLARIPDAEQKYQFFRQQYPHLDNRVPLKIIASYLGIRQETLSRIRSRL
jgi:CRP-like cAMP-binding protein